MDRLLKKLLENKKRVLIAVIILIIVLYALAFYFYYHKGFSVQGDDPFATSKVTVLVTGSDTPIESPPRSDTIFLASINLEEGDTGIMFVPRDTRLDIPGYGTNKINAAYALGGIELLEETLESFLQIPVDYHIDLDFAGFSSIVDVLGGIEVEVERELNYVDRAGDLEIDIPAGRQKLDGEQALNYVRYREPIYGDIGRIRRQQKFIRSGFERLRSPDIITKLPALYNELRKNIETNIPYGDITPFLRILKQMNMEQLQIETLPGEPRYIEGISFWLPEHEQIEGLVDSLIRSKEYIQNQQYEVLIYNGNGVSGAAGEAAEGLEIYGFSITGLRNADHFDYDTTIITYYDSSKKEIAAGLQEILGGVTVLNENGEDRPNNFEIILGKDYVED